MPSPYRKDGLPNRSHTYNLPKPRKLFLSSLRGADAKITLKMSSERPPHPSAISHPGRGLAPRAINAMLRYFSTSDSSVRRRCCSQSTLSSSFSLCSFNTFSSVFRLAITLAESASALSRAFSARLRND